jgi:tRNA pseudouridine55 synthase
VKAVRRLFGGAKAGHTGTLDPFATGLLPVCLGRATRLSRFVASSDKTYRAVVAFGMATDTYDATGTALAPPVPVTLNRDALCRELEGFRGEQWQTPPPFAAKKIGGQRMYRLARAGVAITAPPIKVRIVRLELLDAEDERIHIEVEVSSGTYIRSLAHELGIRLGVGAHLAELRRVAVGPFHVEDALGLDALAERCRTGRWAEVVLDPAVALAHLVLLRLSERGAAHASQGRRVSSADWVVPAGGVDPGVPCRLVGPRGELLGVGIRSENGADIRPIVVLTGGATR